MTKSPRPNVTRNLSHARGPARCYKNFQARPGVLRPEPGPSPNGLRAWGGHATSTQYIQVGGKYPPTLPGSTPMDHDPFNRRFPQEGLRSVVSNLLYPEPIPDLYTSSFNCTVKLKFIKLKLP